MYCTSKLSILRVKSLEDTAKKATIKKKTGRTWRRNIRKTQNTPSRPDRCPQEAARLQRNIARITKIASLRAPTIPFLYCNALPPPPSGPITPQSYSKAEFNSVYRFNDPTKEKSEYGQN